MNQERIQAHFGLTEAQARSIVEGAHSTMQIAAWLWPNTDVATEAKPEGIEAQPLVKMADALAAIKAARVQALEEQESVAWQCRLKVDGATWQYIPVELVAGQLSAGYEVRELVVRRESGRW